MNYDISERQQVTFSQVMYTTSKHHSMIPGRPRSSPEDINVPVVGSCRGEPIRSRYRERKIDGIRERTYIQKENVFGDKEPRWRSTRRTSESTPAMIMPRRRFLIVPTFCVAVDFEVSLNAAGNKFMHLPTRFAEAFAIARVRFQCNVAVALCPYLRTRVSCHF